MSEDVAATSPPPESWLYLRVTAVLRSLVGLYFRCFYRLRVEGLEHVPTSGPVILAPNHQSNYDGPLVGFSLRRPFHPMVAAAYCNAPILGWVLRSLGAIPVAGGRDRGAYRKVLQVLESGRVAAIFPEGHRSRSGRLMRLQDGAARAALTLGVDIVPVSLLGVYDAWPRQRLAPRLFKPLVVRYHPPIRCRAVARQDLKAEIARVNDALESTLRPALEAWEESKARR